MIVDCMTCPVRGHNCDDCAITVLRAPRAAEHLSSWDVRPPGDLQLSVDLQLDAAENRAVSMLVGAGLVKPGAVATLRARREGVLHRQAERDVG